MNTVYIVHHSYETTDGCDETKLIGVFSTESAAKSAVEQLKAAPGFRDLPEHFHINAHQLDRVHWESGYVTERYVPIWSVWRQDDNGNVFMVSNGHVESEALRLVREFESKAHKQVYWAKENL